MKVLETERLILRPWRLEDAADMYAYAKNPNVGPNAGWKPHESVEESKAILESWIHSDEEEDIWAIVPKEMGRACGSIGLHQDGRRPGVPNCRELGYVLGQEQWGKGYMTEAAKAVLRYGFAELGLELIAVRHHLHNQRSRRVIEKCGFHYEGTMRQYSRLYDGTILDGCFYSLTAQEFAAANSMPRDNSALARAMCRYEWDWSSGSTIFSRFTASPRLLGRGRATRRRPASCWKRRPWSTISESVPAWKSMAAPPALTRKRRAPPSRRPCWRNWAIRPPLWSGCAFWWATTTPTPP